MVDLILQTTLDEADLTGEDLDSIFITLDCKHIFTVETLDGVCGLKDYYQREGERWIQPILPPAGSVKAPVCPQCRGEIRSPRYGRVLKRCNLDLLERTVATDTANRLQRVHAGHLALAPATLKSLITSRIRNTQGESLDSRQLLQITAAYEDHKRAILQRPFDPRHFWGSRLIREYGIRADLANDWDSVLNGIRKVYQDAYDIAATQSSHRIAYESALSRLYRQELGAIISGPQIQAGDQEKALSSAKVKVGMSPPLADRRFFVEAIWITIDLRLMAATIASGLQEQVARAERENQSVISRALRWMSSAPNPEGQGKALSLFVKFIHNTCTIDAQLARKTAETSGASRQVLKCELKLLLITLEEFNFKVRLLEGEPAATLTEKRKELAAAAKDHQTQTQLFINRATEEHFRRKGHTHEEIKWVEENFMQTAKEILGSWSNAIRKLNGGTFFQPISIEEKRQIQQAFGFSEYFHG